MTRRFLIDAAERVAATFVEAFAGAVVLAAALDLSMLESAALAGTIAAAATVKAAAASFLGSRDSAAALPATVDPSAGDQRR